MPTLYEILGVAADAAQDVIKKAYRSKAKDLHPDTGGDPEDFHALAKAYDILSNADTRARYDETGTYEEPEPDNSRAMAVHLINTFTLQVLNEDGAIHTDIVALITARIQNEIKAVNGERDEAKEKIARLNRFLGRLKSDGPIRATIQKVISDLGGAMKVFEERTKISELAVTLLKDEEFDPEPRPEPPAMNFEEAYRAWEKLDRHPRFQDMFTSNPQHR